MNLKKILPQYLVYGLCAILCSGLFGCASESQTGNLLTDIVTDVSAVGVAAQDAYTALQAASQSMGGHGLSIQNAIAYAGQEASAANTAGLTTALATVVNDVSSQYAQLTNSGSTGAAAAAAVQTTIAQAQIAVGANSPTPSTNAMWHPAQPGKIEVAEAV